tara:strand:+ start:621 stop:1151 length:531 start_codon:yes stop_codon:yes gene_type:complete
MSQLKVNSIVPAGGLPSGANGGIIQVIQTTKTSVFTWTGNGNQEITGMGVTITPSSSSNKILIQCEIGACGMYESGYPLFFVLYKGSSVISGALGDELSNGQQTCTTYHKFENYWEGGSTSFAYLDSPATTSATTYKLYGQRHTDGGTGYFNTTARQTNNRYAKSLSTITAFEVSA